MGKFLLCLVVVISLAQSSQAGWRSFTRRVGKQLVRHVVVPTLIGYGDQQESAEKKTEAVYDNQLKMLFQGLKEDVGGEAKARKIIKDMAAMWATDQDAAKQDTEDDFNVSNQAEQSSEEADTATDVDSDV